MNLKGEKGMFFKKNLFLANLQDKMQAIYF